MSAPSIPLEDDACDVISKAMHGLEISPGQLAKMTGLSQEVIEAALRGEHTDQTLEDIAPVLGLSSPALTGLATYRPEALPPEGLTCFVTRFGHAGVNAYAVAAGRQTLVFDTGTDPSPIVRYLAEENPRQTLLYITHRHHDHIAGLPAFGDSKIIYPEDAHPGSQRKITEGHQLTILDVSGHANPARAYLYQGLDVPVCIVGDSIFAGSMGKTPNNESYRLALQTARQNVMSLPGNTLLCPGHGPLTTVASELANNPFFPPLIG